MNKIRSLKWQLSCFLKAWEKRNNHIFVKPSHFLATVWLRRGMEIAKNAVYNSTRRPHSVTKFSCLYVQKAKFGPVALSLPSSSASLPLFDGHWLKFISVGKGFGKTKDGWWNKIFISQVVRSFLHLFLVSSITTQQFNNHTISSMTMH